MQGQCLCGKTVFSFELINHDVHACHCSICRKQTSDANMTIDIEAGSLKFFSVHDKFHRTLILSGICLLKIARISLNSSFFPKPIKR